MALARRALNLCRLRSQSVCNGRNDLRSQPRTAGRLLYRHLVRPGRERLQGTVEVDETYVGGIEQGTRGRGTERKFIVAIAIEVLSPIGFWRVRLKRVVDASSRSLIPFVQFTIEPGSQVNTDGWKSYAGLAKEGYEHHAVSISGSGDPAHVIMPGVHKIASLLKRWMLGTHQGSVTATHLGAYLDEFAFRFNRRKSRRRGMLFYRLLENAVVTQPTRFWPSRPSQTTSKHNCTKAATSQLEFPGCSLRPWQATSKTYAGYCARCTRRSSLRGEPVQTTSGNRTGGRAVGRPGLQPRGLQLPSAA
jgi:transposase-like protein